jgi:hypothetical protein
MNLCLLMAMLPFSLDLPFSLTANSSQNPPVRYCSANAFEQGREERAAAEAGSVNYLPESTYDERTELENEGSERLLSVFGPAQDDISAGAGKLLASG